jgi:hypothetical protein
MTVLNISLNALTIISVSAEGKAFFRTSISP